MDVIVDEAIAPPPGGGRGRIVRIVKSGPANGTVGVNFTYTITITNTGSSDAMGITMSDPLPAGLSREDVTFTAGVTGCIGVVVINCTVAPLAPSASVSIFIEVMPTAAGNYTNIANLSVADPPESASNRQRTRVVLLMAPPQRASSHHYADYEPSRPSAWRRQHSGPSHLQRVLERSDR